MRHMFTLVYEIPLDLIHIEPAMNELAQVGLRGGGQNETSLSLWFSYEAESMPEAVEGAKEAVAKALPQVTFIKVRQQPCERTE